jgi:hypothetical protein
MKIGKKQALALIEEKIIQFKRVLENAKYENRYDMDYKKAYHGTETLLKELFSEEEAKNFRRNVTSMFAVVGGRIDYERELKHYREHINNCIAQLEVYHERVSNFWDDTEKEKLKTIIDQSKTAPDFRAKVQPDPKKNIRGLWTK